MKLLTKLFLFILLMAGGITTSNAQSGSSSKASTNALPKVFVIGEQEKAQEKLMMEYEAQLINVCNNDMNRAFDTWIGMMKELEAFAETTGFDLEGVKLWLHVFWAPDGQIQHMGFHLRPNSRNIETEKVATFLGNFIQFYKLPISGKQNFSHYTTVSFPTSFQRVAAKN